jgi:hypothetical protein
MKKIWILLLIGSALVYADTNVTKGVVKVTDKNTTKNIQTKKLSKEEILKKQLKKQMEREERYAKEQKFYQGKDYNLKDKEIDKASLEHLPSIEPDYDFDITDVYADEQ